MPKTYEKANVEVRKVIEEVRQKWHPELDEADVKLGVMMVGPDLDDNGVAKGPALERMGNPVAAKISKCSAKDREAKGYDAELLISEPAWKELDHDRRLALIDHELTHLELKPGEEGEKWATNDDGRPVIKMRPDDFVITGFESVIRRHQGAAIEYQALKAHYDRAGQGLFSFAADYGVEQKPEEPAAESEGDAKPARGRGKKHAAANA